MMTAVLLLTLCLLLLTPIGAWKLNNVNRWVAASAVAVGLGVEPSFAANDAFIAAQRAMSATKEREVKIRSFDEMNPSAKKRYALEQCKDKTALRQADYKSTAECNAAVLSGDYASIVGGRETEPTVQFDKNDKATVQAAAAPVPSSAPAVIKPRETSAAKISAVSSSSSTSTAAATTKLQAPRKKSQDFSGVSSSGLRRRALAACKKSEVRKAANMRSESYCTERVLNDDYSSVIEALEYF